MANDFRSAYSLLDYYSDQYFAKYGRQPTVNRYRDKWGALEVCKDLGLREAKLLVDYYFRTETQGHPLTTFFNSYDVLATNRATQIADREKISTIMKETEKRVNSGR